MKFKNNADIYYGLGFPLPQDSVEFYFRSDTSRYYFKGKWGSDNLSGTWSDEKDIYKGSFSGKRSY